MDNKRQYTRGELQDAAALANILASVSEAKRPMFSLAVEAMMLGAELAEKSLAAQPACPGA